MASTAVLFFILISPAIAESIEMPEMPQMPQMTQMPEISAPTMDSSFYTPTNPQFKKTAADSETETKTENSAVTNELMFSNATTSDDLISAFLNENSTLTAKDINSLYDSGLFTDVSSLNTTSSSVTTNLLLNQVLSSLNDLKTEQKTATPAQKEVLNDAQTDSQTFKKREPAILRFKINGYNLLDSFTTVFFSEPEADGTFLLSADRKYFADNKTRTETFYILFKAVKNSGEGVSYEIQPSIVQDYKNENSFIYRMSQKKNLQAEKTGNLVCLHSSDNDLNVDLLLNIDK